MEKMVMIGNVGVEVRALRIDNDFPQQADGGELMQGVVDGRQRHPDLGGLGIGVENFRGDMPVPAFKQQFCQSEALARRAQADAAKPFQNLGKRPLRI